MCLDLMFYKYRLYVMDLYMEDARTFIKPLETYFASM